MPPDIGLAQKKGGQSRKNRLSLTQTPQAVWGQSSFLCKAPDMALSNELGSEE
jgi:hypothetical protein